MISLIVLASLSWFQTIIPKKALLDYFSKNMAKTISFTMLAPLSWFIFSKHYSKILFDRPIHTSMAKRYFYHVGHSILFYCLRKICSVVSQNDGKCALQKVWKGKNHQEKSDTEQLLCAQFSLRHKDRDADRLGTIKKALTIIFYTLHYNKQFSKHFIIWAHFC